MYKVKLIKIIALLEQLIIEEDFGAYHKILKSYRTVKRNIMEKKEEQMTEEDFISLQNVYRIYTEAPPSNVVLGTDIRNHMQELYELERKILEL